MKNLKLPSFWATVAGIVLGLGLYATIIRFTQGLGASTGLSDDFPWGLWIGFDVMVGVGLAAGGFTVAATVHIFNNEKYEPISRPSILTAFLGYLLVIVGLIFDIGQPWRLWHPLIMWNPHSVMFEVAWCVMLYTTVLALEFSPIVFERFKLHVPLRLVRTIYLPLVIAGVLLSTLHQSSLGTVYVIVPDKLYGLWYSPLLPVFFFITAIAAGLAMTIVESFLSSRAFGKEIESELLDGLGKIIAVVLAVYLVLKFKDLHYRENLSLLLIFNSKGVLFWGEVGFGVLLPMALLFSERIRRSHSALFFSALLVVIGFIINRLNVSITGMPHSEKYFPHWAEISITLSLVVLGFVLFRLAVKHLPVFEAHHGLTFSPYRREVLSLRLITALWIFLLVGVVSLSLAFTYESRNNTAPAEISRKATPESEPLTNLPKEVIYHEQSNSMGRVAFNHDTHLSFQEDLHCGTCHPTLYGFNRMYFVLQRGELMHGESSCGSCHNGKKAFSVEEDCSNCHKEE